MKSLFHFTLIPMLLVCCSSAQSADYSAKITISEKNPIHRDAFLIESGCVEKELIQPLWKQVYHSEFDTQKNENQRFITGDLTHIARQYDKNSKLEKAVTIALFDESADISIYESESEARLVETTAPKDVRYDLHTPAKLNLIIPHLRIQLLSASGADRDFARITHQSGHATLSVTGTEAHFFLIRHSLEKLSPEEAFKLQTLRALNLGAYKNCLVERSKQLQSKLTSTPSAARR